MDTPESSGSSDPHQPMDPRARAAFASDKLKKVNLFDSPRMFVDVWGLQPGQHQKPHRHDDADKFYLALEGEGRVTIGSRESCLRAGELAICPAGMDHGIRNDGPAPLVLLVGMTRPGATA